MSPGLVFDLQRFAVHDGPGLRTSVFLKGCDLRCPWCQNPEGLQLRTQLWYFEKKCIRCLRCLAACPRGALSQDSAQRGAIRIDRERCDLCGKCVEVCPARALVFDSRRMSAAEVMEVVRRDRVFYAASGGGVTLSGGDPLVQHGFALELLEASRREGLHTVVESCLYAEQAIVSSLDEAVDLWIVDMKLRDPEAHRRCTGADNAVILANLEMLAAQRKSLLVRIPLIPGLTALEENLRRIAVFLKGLKTEPPVELLNYNPLAEDKYRLLGLPSPAGAGVGPFSEERLAEFRGLLRQEGIQVVAES